MSARSRSGPWFRPTLRSRRMRYWKACAAWRLDAKNRWLHAPTRSATAVDVPEDAVQRVLGAT